MLFKAFGDVAPRCNWDLVLAGPSDASYLADLQYLAKEVAPEGKVHFAGMLEGDAKWGALHGCDAMILPSYQENFGVVVAEALGCQRPVLISDQVNIADEVLKAEAGLVCETSVESVSGMLREFHTMNQFSRNQMGTNGQSLFEQKFRIEATANRLISVLSKRRDHDLTESQ